MSTDKGDTSPLGSIGARWRDTFERYMKTFFGQDHDDIPPRLLSSIMYSMTSEGKRLRPLLCLATAEACGGDGTQALPVALAIEMIHTASLIHDDLPCMDDDDLRRGKPTNHVVYGDGLAMLAADSLWLWAFGVAASGLRHADVSPDRALQAIEILSDGAGPFGMCGGQVLDTDPESSSDDLSFVYMISSMKTAALIRASVLSGAVIGGARDEDLDQWGAYGTHLGVAFQMMDDILDVTRSTEQLGKTAGKDERDGKRTFVSEFGIEEAIELARDESESAANALTALFPSGHPLIDLARDLEKRRY